MDGRQKRLVGTDLSQLKLQHGAVQPAPAWLSNQIPNSPNVRQGFRTGHGGGAAWIAAHQNVTPDFDNNL